MAVQNSATAASAPQAVGLTGCSGQSQRVGRARPRAAPIWLPVAVANGWAPVR